MNHHENSNIDSTIFEDAIWFRLLTAISISTLGAFAIGKQLIPLYSAPIFLAVSILFYAKARGYVQVDNLFITLSGPMSIGRLKKLPIDKIQLIDSVTTSGVTNFRVWFDPCIIRSKFWQGTDNPFFINPIAIKGSNELLANIMSKAKSASIDDSVQEFIEGKKQIKSRAGIVLIGGVSLVFVFFSIIMIMEII